MTSEVSEMINSQGEMYKEVEDINIRISGLSEEEIDVREGVYGEIIRSLIKMKKMAQIIDFTLNVKTYHEEGNRKKYSINTGIMSGIGHFKSDETEWDIFKAVKAALEKLEREVYKKEDKLKEHKN